MARHLPTTRWTHPTAADFDRPLRKLKETFGIPLTTLTTRSGMCFSKFSSRAASKGSLGGKITKAKERAPPRPYPSAPDKPPASLILEAGA